MAMAVLAVFACRTARRAHDRRGSSRWSLHTWISCLGPLLAELSSMLLVYPPLSFENLFTPASKWLNVFLRQRGYWLLDIFVHYAHLYYLVSDDCSLTLL
jgi:hypothetical protein